MSHALHEHAPTRLVLRGAQSLLPLGHHQIETRLRLYVRQRFDLHVVESIALDHLRIARQIDEMASYRAGLPACFHRLSLVYFLCHCACWAIFMMPYIEA